MKKSLVTAFALATTTLIGSPVFAGSPAETETASVEPAVRITIEADQRPEIVVMEQRDDEAATDSVSLTRTWTFADLSQDDSSYGHVGGSLLESADQGRPSHLPDGTVVLFTIRF